MNPLAEKNPHRRFNSLKQDWVLVSPNRTQRPWQGQMEKPVTPVTLTYDPDCYLCPGNMRAGGPGPTAIRPRMSSRTIIQL